MKAKRLRLLPSLREKKRYVLFEVLSQKRVKEDSVQQAIEQTLLDVYGVHGLSSLSVKFLPETWNAQLQQGIFRVNHLATNALKTAFVFTSMITDTPVIMRSLTTSGTILTVKEQRGG